MSDHNPTMFCHDGTTIYYPTGPGRVHMITIAALADCDGGDSDFEDSTAVGDLTGMANATREHRYLNFCNRHPVAWPQVTEEVNGDIVGPVNHEETAADFADCLEQWADWCDRDAERLDSLDGPAPTDGDAAGILARLRALVARTPYTLGTMTEVVEAISGSQPAIAI